MTQNGSMKTDIGDLISKFISQVLKFFKVVLKGLLAISVAASIISVLIGIYGPERIRDIVKEISNDFLALKTIFQISFTVALLSVIIAAFLCVMYANKTYQSLTSVSEKNDKRLNSIQDLLEREKNLGILAINSRRSSKYSNDSYKLLFNRTNEELIISGHSLNKTINKKTSVVLRDEFIATIIRLLENKRVVKILLVKPHESKERIEKRKEFDDFVNELYGKLKAKNIQNKTIRDHLHIKETDFLPHYIVKNEYILYIAHYTFGEYMDSSDGKMYIFEAVSDFGYGQYCYDDFISCFDKSEYIQQYRNMIERDENV